MPATDTSRSTQHEANHPKSQEVSRILSVTPITSDFGIEIGSRYQARGPGMNRRDWLYLLWSLAFGRRIERQDRVRPVGAAFIHDNDVTPTLVAAKNPINVEADGVRITASQDILRNQWLITLRRYGTPMEITTANLQWGCYFLEFLPTGAVAEFRAAVQRFMEMQNRISREAEAGATE